MSRSFLWIVLTDNFCTYIGFFWNKCFMLLSITVSIMWGLPALGRFATDSQVSDLFIIFYMAPLLTQNFRNLIVQHTVISKVLFCILIYRTFILILFLYLLFIFYFKKLYPKVPKPLSRSVEGIIKTLRTN